MMNNYEELIQTTEQEYSCTVCAKEEKEPALSDEFSGELIATAIIGILVIALLAIAAHKLEQIKNDMDELIRLLKNDKSEFADSSAMKNSDFNEASDSSKSSKSKNTAPIDRLFQRNAKN